jgi:hypothetical protein
MQSPDYRELLNALLQVQSVEELVALAQQHPELLSEEFLRYAQQQVDQMNPQEAITLIECLLLLARAIIHASVQADAPVSQPADAFDIPDDIPPSDDPPRCVGETVSAIYRAWGTRSCALAPLQHAQQAGEREIAALIALLAQGEIVAAAEQAQRLFVSLHQQGDWKRRTACCCCRYWGKRCWWSSSASSRWSSRGLRCRRGCKRVSRATISVAPCATNRAKRCFVGQGQGALQGEAAGGGVGGA